METSFLTDATFNNTVATAEPVNSLSSNSLIENIQGTLSQILDNLYQSINNIGVQVSQILNEGLNAETDTKIAQVIGGIDPMIDQTLEQVNHLIDSQFSISSEGVLDLLTGEMIVPNLFGEATVITGIDQPLLEMTLSDPMMAMSQPLLGEMVSLTSEIATHNPLLQDTVNNPLMGTIEPLVNGVVNDSSLSIF